jgi:hypothetical protein
LQSQRNNPCLAFDLEAVDCSIYGYGKEMNMIYERDPESPFSKILVKNGSSVVGTIRRNLITGNYHFYDNQRDTLNCVLQEKRIDSMKMRIEELLNLRKAS